jgi:hypothetical protein
MLFPVHTFLRLSQATHAPKAVACVFQLIFLLSQTLNTVEPLQIFNPALVAPSKDMTDPASYSDNPVYVEHDCLDPMVQQCRRLLRESIEDRFHRQQGYAVKRVKVDRNKHERVKLAQQRCWVLDMAFFLYPPQVASSKCMLRVMFLPEMQGYSGRPTLCRTCSCCSTNADCKTKWCRNAEYRLGRRLPQRCNNTRSSLRSTTTPSTIPTSRALVCWR